MFGRLAGYEDVNDAERLDRDPPMRWVVGDRAITGSAASASQMGHFETKWLSRPENLTAHSALPGRGSARCTSGDHLRAIGAAVVGDYHFAGAAAAGEEGPSLGNALARVSASFSKH